MIISKLPRAIPTVTDAKGRTFNRAPDGAIVHNDIGYKNFIDVNPWLRICSRNVIATYAIFTFQANGTWKFENEDLGSIELAIDAAEEIIAEEDEKNDHWEDRDDHWYLDPKDEFDERLVAGIKDEAESDAFFANNHD
jgi:hypothetical protein